MKLFLYSEIPDILDDNIDPDENSSEGSDE
jgi:hypothetical protein